MQRRKGRGSVSKIVGALQLVVRSLDPMVQPESERKGVSGKGGGIFKRGCGQLQRKSRKRGVAYLKGVWPVAEKVWKSKKGCGKVGEVAEALQIVARLLGRSKLRLGQNLKVGGVAGEQRGVARLVRS